MRLHSLTGAASGYVLRGASSLGVSPKGAKLDYYPDWLNGAQGLNGELSLRYAQYSSNIWDDLSKIHDLKIAPNINIKTLKGQQCWKWEIVTKRGVSVCLITPILETSPFSDRVKQARRATGLSQRAAAEILDMRMQTLARWESRQYEPASYVQKLILEKLLAITAEKIDGLK